MRGRDSMSEAKRVRTKPGYKLKNGETPLINLDPERKYGPAMSRLTDARKRFVLAYVMKGGRNTSECARWAGYKDSKEIKKTAYGLTHDPFVLEAIREEADIFFRGSVLRAGHKLDELLDSDQPRIALEAAKELLNRGGMIVATQHNVTVEHIETRSTEELLEIVRKFQADSPLLAAPVPKPRQLAIDAEFTVVEPDVAQVRENEHSQMSADGDSEKGENV